MSSTKPKHVAIIMDGNRRYAKTNGKSTEFGHEMGFNNIVSFTKEFLKTEIKYLTLFCFSTENWNRDADEINNIIKLINRYIEKNQQDELLSKMIRVRFIGDRGYSKYTNRKFDFDKVNEKMLDLENSTKKNTSLNLNIAFNYGGIADIIQSADKLMKKNEEINSNSIKKNLWTRDLPPVDIMIRTGGDVRISNFLLWDLAYSELFFVDKKWPLFTINDFNNILNKYLKKERRFGK